MSDFLDLHVPGKPFILANAWDMGTARMLVALGAKAVATSSAAHAFTLGRPDGGTLSRDEALDHARQMAAEVPVPVQGDFENGFGAEPETCAETVRLAAEAGLAGICIEDTDLPGEAPYAPDLATARIAAAAAACPPGFVLTARADGVLTGQYDVDEAIRRLTAFADAGAHCLYAPGLPDMEAVARTCRAVEGPVNILAAGPMVRHTLAEFANAGAARISLGSSLARVTHKAILDAATAMFEGGDFSPLGNGASSAIVDPLLTKELFQ